MLLRGNRSAVIQATKTFRALQNWVYSLHSPTGLTDFPSWARATALAGRCVAKQMLNLTRLSKGLVHMIDYPLLQKRQWIARIRQQPSPEKPAD